MALSISGLECNTWDRQILSKSWVLHKRRNNLRDGSMFMWHVQAAKWSSSGISSAAREASSSPLLLHINWNLLQSQPVWSATWFKRFNPLKSPPSSSSAAHISTQPPTRFSSQEGGISRGGSNIQMRENQNCAVCRLSPIENRERIGVLCGARARSVALIKPKNINWCGAPGAINTSARHTDAHYCFQLNGGQKF